MEQSLSSTGKLTQFLIEFLIKLIEYVVPPVKERRLNLERELDTDKPTGLANRAAFDKARASAEADKKTAFIVFDCNNFGLVNKRIGHSMGDELIYEIALEIKRACFAYNARSFRYGGDEFVVLVNRRFAEQLRDSIERRVGTFTFDSFEVSISGAVGKTFAEADATLQARKKERK
ncbi:MAG TPA: diguanylate cyclase [Pyrinomonadaceae bacterium]|jgi:diguanylate cyclase (GGDEF)-like protein